MTLPNQKTSTASYKTSYEDFYKSQNLNKHPVTSVGIDKISVVIPVSDMEYIEETAKCFWIGLKSPELGYKHAKKTQGFKTCLTIEHVPSSHTIQKGSPVHIQLHHFDPKRPQIRIEWNPLKMPEEFLEQVDDKLQVMMGFGFFELLSKAKVTRIDLAVEAFNTDVEDFLFKITGYRIARTFFDQKGKIQSMNFGSSKGNQYVVYSKSAELGLLDLGHTVRIEARMRPKKLWMKDIASMPNPLEAVQIFGLENTDATIDPSFWLAFKDACRYRSLNNAVKLQPAKMRNKLKKALTSNKADWWEPHKFWGDRWIDFLEEKDFLNLPFCPEITKANASGET